MKSALQRKIEDQTWDYIKLFSRELRLPVTAVCKLLLTRYFTVGFAYVNDKKSL